MSGILPFGLNIDESVNFDLTLKFIRFANSKAYYFPSMDFKIVLVLVKKRVMLSQLNNNPLFHVLNTYDVLNVLLIYYSFEIGTATQNLYQTEGQC